MAEIISFGEVIKKAPQTNQQPFTDEAASEFSEIHSGVIVKLVKFADKHNIDRDDLIGFFAVTFGTMVNVSTFENFDTQK